MKLLLVLCAVVAVAVASVYGGGNDNYGNAPQYDQNNYDSNPFYKPHHYRRGRHGRHGKHHRRYHSDSSDSDSDSDSDSYSRSSSSSGSHSYERHDEYYRHRPMPYRHFQPAYGQATYDAPAATNYGAPSNDVPAPAPYGVNTFGRK